MSWIKMRTDLRDHPKVVRMASALKADRLRVIGGLWAVWGTFDTHSPDGLLEGYTPESLDEGLGWKGFAAAMVAVKWLSVAHDGLSMPDYEEHNGSSAKRRSQDTKAKKAGRDADKSAHGSWTPDGQMSASEADKSGTRVRLDKEEEIPPTPKGEGRFPDFWSSWPNTDRKADRKKCLEKWRRNAWDSEADSIIAHVAAMKASRKWIDGFEPAPLTYLNGERWRDGVATERANEYAGVI
jgi:hypothetical protein